MKIFDMFSWLPAQELSLEQIEEMFVNHIQGNQIKNGYLISHELPETVSEDILQYKREATEDGKKIACIMKGNKFVALIGYRE